MTLLEYYDKGIIKDLFSKGAINVNLMTYFRYYEVYLAYRGKGFSKNKSRIFASDECGCHPDTIKNAIRAVTR